MILEHFDTPWKHTVVDEFFEEEDFKIIEKVSDDLTLLIDSAPQLKKRTVVSLPFMMNFKDFFNHISDDLVEQIDYLNTIFPYYAAQLLSNLGIVGDNASTNSTPLFCRSQKGGMPDNNIFELAHNDIHTDSSNKFLSLVIYVGEDNLGTNVYSDVDENSLVKQVEWKKNRAFVFKRQNFVSWHSVPDQSQTTNARKTILFPMLHQSNDHIHLKRLKEYLNEPV